jgi:hypothetical protein
MVRAKIQIKEFIKVFKYLLEAKGVYWRVKEEASSSVSSQLVLQIRNNKFI